MTKKEDSQMSLEEKVAEIRRKRDRQVISPKMRNLMNTAFLLLALIGLIIYFQSDSHRVLALSIIGAGMLIKLVEIVSRILGR